MDGLEGAGQDTATIIWWALAIVSIVVVVWSLARGASARRQRRQAESPEDAVRRRYARGEIDRATYRDRLRNLRA